MNETIKLMKSHRTIRFFQDKPVEEELLQAGLEAMNRTATSNGMQTASLLRITDPNLKQALADIGKQAYIAKAPELFVFLVDGRRRYLIAEEKGVDPSLNGSTDVFIQGFTDASLMAQNLALAFESLGLGTAYLGSILNDPAQLVQVLNLPDLVMPVVGLMCGYPNDNPQLKPRIPLNLKVMENSYQDNKPYLDFLADYDEEMTHYYDTREKNRRSDTYSDQVARRSQAPVENRDQYLQVAKSQGFDL